MKKLKEAPIDEEQHVMHVSEKLILLNCSYYSHLSMDSINSDENINDIFMDI